MAKTANNTSSKIDFGKLVDDITDDPAVATISSIPHHEPITNQITVQNVDSELESNTPLELETPAETIESLPETLADTISSLEKRLAAQKKKTKGYQKSVYFDEDTYKYVLEKQAKYNLRVSQVINEIIRDAMSKDK